MRSFLPTFIISFLLALLLSPVSGYPQLSTSGVPVSFTRALPPSGAPEMHLPAPLTEKLLQEDLVTPVPFRFAVNLPADFSTDDFQTMQQPDGTVVKRLTFNAPGALGLILFFDRFHLPEGGKLYVYNATRTDLAGAFTSLNNNPLSTFATRMIHGDKITIEYNAAEGTPSPLLHISEIGYAYRGTEGGQSVNTGFGASGDCEVNINCSEGSLWQRQKRGVTRIQVKRGAASLYCSGSLVNNTLNNGTPYILTADHCGRLSTAIDLSQWVFTFGYESPACNKPPSEPYLRTMTGATRIASGGESGSKGSDFFLVKLMQDIPDSFNVYYNGWSREVTPPSFGVSVHHPQGDIKKISTYTTPLQSVIWPGGTKKAHWMVRWSETENGHGATEPGSSGSPLFDGAGHIIGTLTGGDSSCDSASLTMPDYYGMFSYHWDKNGDDSTSQLKPWLDPVGADVAAVNGWALRVTELKPAETLSVYPNPAEDILYTVVPTSWKGEIHYSITDIFGKQQMKSILDSGSQEEATGIDIHRLPPGLYFLVISGESTRVTRFIKTNP